MTMVKRQWHIMWIDWWSKYVGVAYMNDEDMVPMPVGYLQNDGSMFFNIGELIVRYRVHTIAVGYPRRQKDIQEKIDKFIKSLSFIIDPEKTKIIKVDEDYTTAQAGEIVSNFKKNVATDTVSAMVLLERFASLVKKIQ